MENSRADYAGVKLSRTGKPVPVFSDGTALNSLYDPEREAKQIVDSIAPGRFVLFAGIGGGYHIREYLERYPGVPCIVAESDAPNLKRLASLVDISDILQDPRVTVVPDCTDGRLKTLLPETYLPAIHGDFAVVPLRSWQTRNGQRYAILGTAIRDALSGISADYSVQSHFGRLWFRNILINLGIASKTSFTVPTGCIPGKTAVIAAAGPGLEDFLPRLASDRDRYVIFSTDTAYSTLHSSGIIPDYFVSIDAQSVSASHVIQPLSPATTCILDLCGNPDISIRARECGSPVLYAAGGHPLARYAALFGNLPILDTSSGTVTLAALHAAHACGYDEALLPGADFAYVNGKPYARGTYLEHGYGKTSNRLTPAEQLYAALMFRTPVSRTVSETGITYSTETLDRYALACKNAKKGYRWNGGSVQPFRFGLFMKEYGERLQALHDRQDPADPVFATLLPFVAWHRACCFRRNAKPELEDAIKLAFDLIARYTFVS